MSESALVSIVKVLEETYTPTGVTIWLNARNKYLDHRTPIELIDFGHGDRVLEVARAIEERH